MKICSECNRSLSDPQVVEIDGDVYQSCLNCSVNNGVHVFYKYEDFGMIAIGNNWLIVQSWCPSCCSIENLALEIEFTC